MFLTILFLPIFGSIIGGLLGRKIGVTGTHIVTTGSLIISALLSIVVFYEVAINDYSTTVDIGSWINSEILSISWKFLFDSLTVSILLPVLIVSALVHVFSIDYMSTDPHNQRFFSYLSIFTFFMLILVTGENYLIIFVGWEGIGISSYLLINFWFTRIQANKSAIKALVVNRVGDIFLSVAFFAILFALGNIDYSTVFTLAPFMNETVVVTIGLLLLLAAMGKSAQLGLHTWLPDAMEGPTPVSALIHAATLVTAGVYLLMRSSPLIEYGSTTLIVITWVGALTAFFAASTGLLQNDLKRVIAYSTCSQIGYLFIACGLSQYNVALFHLVNHAFFKALLFLAAGAVLHATYDQQDQRRLGGLLGFLPFTYVAILIGSLSLMAVPWMTGFYSKDLILEVAYGQYQFSGHIAYWIGTISACLTAFYSLRLISLTFMTYPNGNKSTYLHVHDAPFIVLIPLTILSLFAIFFGYLAKDLFVGIGSNFLFTHPSHITLIEAEFGLPLINKLLPAIGTIIGAGLALYLYHIQPIFTIQLTNTSIGRNLYKFFNGKYYIDVIYNYYVIYKSLYLGYTISKVLDRGVIELIGPQGLSVSLTSSSKSIARLDTGNLTDYALYMGIGLISVTSILLFNVKIPELLILLVGVLIITNMRTLNNSPYTMIIFIPIIDNTDILYSVVEEDYLQWLLDSMPDWIKIDILNRLPVSGGEIPSSNVATILFYIINVLTYLTVFILFAFTISLRLLLLLFAIQGYQKKYPNSLVRFFPTKYIIIFEKGFILYTGIFIPLNLLGIISHCHPPIVKLDKFADIVLTEKSYPNLNIIESSINILPLKGFYLLWEYSMYVILFLPL